MVYVWVFVLVSFFLFEAIFYWSCPSNPWSACQAIIQNQERGSWLSGWTGKTLGLETGCYENFPNLTGNVIYTFLEGMAVDLPLFRSSSAISEPTEVGFSEELWYVWLLWCCRCPWTLKAEACGLLSRCLSCSLELLWLKSILDKVFLDGGGEGRTLCAMDYKILVLQSTDLSATSLMVAKS